MLNSETKQKINNLRDLLVGKIPNPQGQVQQITLALMYKFMSDIDDSTNELFENTTFFPGGFAEYKWTYIMDSKLSAQERLNLYAEGLEKMNHNPSVPQLFRHIFKQAFLPFRDPQTLDRFLKQIDEFEYEHSEDLGDAFEYLLSSLSAAGDAGQFRTPRHIIDFIVEVVQPDLLDKILDPACGTAGFLVSAYKYLVSHHKDLDMNKISNQIVGYDISPEMVQLALVNLYLHQFPDPKIEEYDTLTSETKRSEKFDCILANPPFMTPKGGITPHNKFSITSNRSEVLFVDYIMEHLKSTGKAGIIVPEGVIFQSANAYKALRKSLIESGGLWAVVSLPAGVFQPYSGVKTSILLLDKTIKTDQIIFAKVTADGYDLGAQRREISNNDLPTVLEDLLDIKGKLKTGQNSEENNNPLIWAVEKSVIADSGDHNLSGERYKVSTSVYQGNWEMVELGEIFDELKIGGTPSRSNQSYFGGENLWVSIKDMEDKNIILDTKEKLTDKGIESSNCKLIKKGSLLMSFKLTVGRTAFAGKDLYTNEAIIAFEPNERINLKYLKHILLKATEQDGSRNNMGALMLNKEKIKKLKIPLPPLEIQEQIVAELDSYQAIIDGAKTILTNRKPKIDIQEDWEMVELGEVCDLQNGYAFKSDDLVKEYMDGYYPVIKIGNIGRDGNIDLNDLQYHHYFENLDKFEIRKGDIVVAMTGATVGKVAFSAYDKLYLNQRCCILRNNQITLQQYLFIVMGDIFYDFCQRNAGGGAQGNISPSQILSFKIPLPSLETQQQIVAQIEQEQKLVDSAKELVQIYENKIQERVRRVWEG